MSTSLKASSPAVCSPTLRLMVLVTTLVLAATAAAAQGKTLNHKMIDLGTLPGMTMTMANFGSLNQRGQVAGWSYVDHYVDDTPFVWEKGVLTALDVPAAVAGPQEINDHGQIAGVWIGEQNGNWGYHGFSYGADGFVPLPDPEGATATWAHCLNNRGTIVGGTVHPDFEFLFGHRPVVWEDGQAGLLPMLDLGPDHVPGGAAHGINDAGQIVGHSGGNFVIDWVNLTVRFNSHATLWEHGQPIDLGTLYGHISSMANAINNAGVVVGQSGVASSGASRAFVWTKQTGIADLGLPPGWMSALAYDVNDRGEIVGCISVIGDPQPAFPSEWGDGPTPWPRNHNHAVLWRAGQCIDLQDFVPAGSPWTLYAACAINARGQILTWAVRDNNPPDPADPGKYYIIHLILLDPIK